MPIALLYHNNDPLIKYISLTLRPGSSPHLEEAEVENSSVVPRLYSLHSLRCSSAALDWEGYQEAAVR